MKFWKLSGVSSLQIKRRPGGYSVFCGITNLYVKFVTDSSVFMTESSVSGEYHKGSFCFMSTFKEKRDGLLFLQKIELFSSLSQPQLSSFYDSFEVVHFQKDGHIIRQGSEGTTTSLFRFFANRLFVTY